MILPTHEPIQPGEDLFGYMLRLATLNGWRGIYRLMPQVGLRSPLASLVGLAENLDELAQTLETSTERLREATLAPQQGHRFGHFHGFGGQKIRGTHILHPRVRVCAGCLREFGFARLTWRLAFVTDCPIHQAPLIVNCPKCGRRLTWGRTSLFRCPGQSCRFDLREANIPKSDPRIVHVASEIERRAVGQAPQIFPWASELCGLQPFLELCDIAGRHAAPALAKSDRSIPRERSLEQIREILVGAADILADWPRGFHAFLDRIFVKPKDESRVRLSKAFPRWYKDLYRRPELGIFRPEFEDYLIARHPHLFARVGSFTSALRKSSNLNRPMSLDEAAKRLGTSPKILLKATAQHGGEFHTGPRGIRRVYRSDLDCLRIALARWRQLPVKGKDLALHFAGKPFPAGDLAGDLPPDLRLPVSYLKDRNGISTSAFDNLISSGVFNRFDGPEMSKEKGLRISAYAQFEEALVNMYARTQGSCERQGIPMLDALKRGLVHCGCTLADLLTAVFDGKVRICGIADASVGLARLLLDAGDVDRAVEYFRQRYRES